MKKTKVKFVSKVRGVSTARICAVVMQSPDARTDPIAVIKKVCQEQGWKLKEEVITTFTYTVTASPKKQKQARKRAAR